MNRQTVAHLREEGLLTRLCDRLRGSASPAVLVDVGDDAAVVAAPAGPLVYTCDTLVEGVHFRFDWSSPADVGWKLLAAALSDIAAMGGRPLFAVISLALPGTTPVDTIDKLYDGLLECAGVFATRVVGGDVVAARTLVLTAAAVGHLPDGAPFRLDQARPGDTLAVSGWLGNAALGVELLRRGGAVGPRAEVCLAAHRRPWPRFDLIEPLHKTGVSCATDTSDGLERDLRKICSASGVGARVEIERLPTHRAALDVSQELGLDLQLFAATAGEDYQLLFTLPAGAGVPAGCRAIGEITATPELRFTRQGEPFTLQQTGYDHFHTS